MREIVAFAAVVIVAIAGVNAFQAAEVDAGVDRVVEDEPFDPAASPVTVDAAGGTGVYLNDPANETVRDESNAVMTEGEDYEYYPSNGTVVVLDDGELANDSTASITYGYQQTTSEQRGLASLLAGHIEVIAAFVFVGVILMLLGALRGVA